MSMDEQVPGCYESLGLRPDATLADAKQAYYDLAKVWHPDRFAHESPRLRSKAEQELKRINEAFRVVERHILSKKAQDRKQTEPSWPQSETRHSRARRDSQGRPPRAGVARYRFLWWALGIGLLTPLTLLALFRVLITDSTDSSRGPTESSDVVTTTLTTTTSVTVEALLQQYSQRLRQDFNTPYRVQVSCTGDDSAGQQFCLVVEEELTASPMFALADGGPWKISLVTLDPDEHANQTVISYALFRRDTFLTHGVALYGSAKLNEGARGIISTLSDQIRQLR